MIIDIKNLIKGYLRLLPFGMDDSLRRLYYRSTIKSRFRKLYGYELNIENPRTFSEKIFYRKYNGNMKSMSFYADKYLVRNYVKEKVGDDFLIPLLGVFERITVKDLELLPNKFVLKTNHGSGAGHVFIVKDKSSENLENLVKKVNYGLRDNFGYACDEEFYSIIDRKIIAEEYIDSGDSDLPDYKFHCFRGHDPYIAVDVDRFRGHKRCVYDSDWNKTDIKLNTFEELDSIPKPQNYEKMLEIAKTLSSDFDYVRVDLYNVNGKVYFGELTQTPANGMELLLPEKYTYLWGSMWNIDVNNKNLYKEKS